MSDDLEEDDETTETVEDPEGFVQTKRLKSIFKAKKQVRERRLLAKSQSKNSSIAYKVALENYLIELKPIFLNNDGGEYVWENKPFGVVELEPDTEKEFRYISPNRIELSGLNSLFSCDEYITLEYEVRSNKATGSMKTKEEHKQIPFSILDEMLNSANQFLADQGIEVETSESKPPAEI